MQEIGTYVITTPSGQYVDACGGLVDDPHTARHMDLHEARARCDSLQGLECQFVAVDAVQAYTAYDEACSLGLA